jgi:hypothetical protein
VPDEFAVISKIRLGTERDAGAIVARLEAYSVPALSCARYLS